MLRRGGGANGRKVFGISMLNAGISSGFGWLLAVDLGGSVVGLFS